jgi:hypothetical protein
MAQKARKATALAASAVAIDLTSIGFPPGYRYRIIYDTKMINTIASMLYFGKYRTDPRAQIQAIDIMLVALGSNGTSCQKARKDGYSISDDEIIKEFESLNLSYDQIRHHVVTVVYNSQRSTNGNKKSSDQKGAVRNVFSKMSPPFCQLKIGEPKDSGLPTKPDGVIIFGNKRIWLYLRYGDSDGGSQGDRKTSMQQCAQAQPNDKFIFICDGIEVDQAKIDAANQCQNAYVSRLAELSESAMRQKLIDQVI